MGTRYQQLRCENCDHRWWVSFDHKTRVELRQLASALPVYGERCPDCDRVYQSVDFVTGTWAVRDDDLRALVARALAAGLPPDLHVWEEGRLDRLRVYRADEPVALGTPTALGGDD